MATSTETLFALLIYTGALCYDIIVYFNFMLYSVVHIKYQFQILLNIILFNFSKHFVVIFDIFSCDNCFLESRHEKVNKASSSVIEPFSTGSFFINYKTGVLCGSRLL
jgi:hypothetical protein